MHKGFKLHYNVSRWRLTKLRNINLYFNNYMEYFINYDLPSFFPIICNIQPVEDTHKLYEAHNKRPMWWCCDSHIFFFFFWKWLWANLQGFHSHGYFPNSSNAPWEQGSEQLFPIFNIQTKLICSQRIKPRTSYTRTLTTTPCSPCCSYLHNIQLHHNLKTWDANTVHHYCTIKHVKRQHGK